MHVRFVNQWSKWEETFSVFEVVYGKGYWNYPAELHVGILGFLWTFRFGEY